MKRIASGKAFRLPRLIGMVAWASLACPATHHAQSIVLPSFEENTLWACNIPPAATRLELGITHSADTNVRPLLRRGTESRFEGRHPYYAGNRLEIMRLHWGKWELGYARGYADLFQGDQGAAQLFLETERGALNPNTAYGVQATLNRSALQRWTLAYRDQFELTPSTGDRRQEGVLRYRITLSWLVLQRVQVGDLAGQKRGDQFEGTLNLTTTRGLPPDAVDGRGVALDVEGELVWHHLRMGVRVENLWSRLQIRRTQRIEARIRVNQPIPDAEGFLRAPPFLEGHIQTVRMERHAMPTLQGFISGSWADREVALMGRYDFEWVVGVGVKRGALWGIAWLNRPALQMGYTTPHWNLTLRLDGLDTARLRRFGVAVQIVLPLK
jgi:hypothetical protein